MKAQRTMWVAAALPFLACGIAFAQNGSASLSNSTYLTTANSGALNPQQLTVEAIIRPTGPGYGQTGDSFGATIVSKPRQGVTGNSLAPWGLYWAPSSQKVIAAIGHIAGSSGTNLFSNGVVPVNSTAHVAMTFDGVTVKLYINGVLDASVTANRSFIFHNPADLILIGASNFPSGFTRRFQGQIDNVKIWNSARSAADIAATTTCLPIGPQPGLLGEWVFNEGGTTASDMSGNGMTATFVGTSAYGVDHGGAPAVVAQQPAPRILCPGSQAEVALTAFGATPLSYQWQVMDSTAPGGWRSLAGGPFTVEGQPWGSSSGANTAACQFMHGAGNSPIQLSTRCVVTSACGSVNSNATTVTVCISDFNCDGVLDLFDYLDFSVEFSGNTPAADFNADTVVDFFDYLDFVAAFAAGC